ncbi:MAG: hypothetical protein GY791_11245 [Alphaproteobacteria bacterium]|nr:hypothetical protein [Alphaproteobacteria bacterium]
MKRWRMPAALLATALVLASCIEPTSTCPRPLVLDRTGELVRFAPGGPANVSNLDYQAKMKVTGLQCGYVDDLLTELEVNMDLDITARRGAANKTGVAEFAYFIAITDVRGTVLSKEVFEVEMDLGSVGEPVTESEGIWQKYQFLKGQSGGAYRIWAGFQMSEHDLAVSRDLRPD